jgi:hypothetical protein
MRSLMWFLIGLVPVAAVIYVVWSYRKSALARTAASRERFAQIFEGVSDPRGTPDSVQTRQPAVRPATPPARVGASYARKARLLTVQQAQLFDLLKDGLPARQVFANVSLAAVIEVCGLPDGREREQRLRALAQHSVDCVVCADAHEVVAVVDLDDGDSAGTRFKSECLKAAGVPYLRWNPLALPPRDGVSRMISDAAP